MGQVYSTPIYLKNSWNTIRNMLDVGVFHGATDWQPLPLWRLQEISEKPVLQEEWRGAATAIAEHDANSLPLMLAQLCAEYAHERKCTSMELIDPEPNDSGQYSCPLRLELLPLGKPEASWQEALSLFMSAEASFSVAANKEFFPDHPVDSARLGLVEANALNNLTAIQILQRNVVEIGKLLRRAERCRNHEPESKAMFEVAKLLREDGIKEGSRNVFREKAAEIVQGRNYKDLLTYFLDFIRLQVVLAINTARLAEDPHDALDFLFSPDGPVQTTVEAAEINSLLAEVLGEAELPDMFSCPDEDENE